MGEGKSITLEEYRKTEEEEKGGGNTDTEDGDTNLSYQDHILQSLP